MDSVPLHGQEIGDTTPPQAAVSRVHPMESIPGTEAHPVWGAPGWSLQGVDRDAEAGTRAHFGELVWIKNSNPDGVVSFVRRRGDGRNLVLINTTTAPHGRGGLAGCGYAGARTWSRNSRFVPRRRDPASVFPARSLDYMVAKRTSGRADTGNEGPIAPESLVAYALVRAVSALVPRPAFGASRRPSLGRSADAAR